MLLQKATLTTLCIFFGAVVEQYYISISTWLANTLWNHKAKQRIFVFKKSQFITVLTPLHTVQRYQIYVHHNRFILWPALPLCTGSDCTAYMEVDRSLETKVAYYTAAHQTCRAWINETVVQCGPKKLPHDLGTVGRYGNLGVQLVD